MPDTFHLMAEYPEGHSLVLSSSMANSQHIPGLIRGHEGTIIMVDHGSSRARRPTSQLGRKSFATAKPGTISRLQVRQGDPDPGGPKRHDDGAHRQLPACMRTREKPHLDVETAAHAQVLISLAVESSAKAALSIGTKELESGR